MIGTIYFYGWLKSPYATCFIYLHGLGDRRLNFFILALGLNSFEPIPRALVITLSKTRDPADRAFNS